MKVAVLNNLRAGKRDSRVRPVLELLGRHPEVLHLETGEDAMVPEALAHFEDAGVDLLVLNGGDGTLQLTLTHLLGGGGSGWRPLLAPIRGGRTNMTAIDLGVRRSPVEGLAALLAARRSGRLEECIVERPVLRIEMAGEPARYGMFMGAGMLHRAVDFTHRAFPPGRSQGVLGAALVTALLVGRAATGSLEGLLVPDKMRIARDGCVDPPGEIVLALATTLERLFLRMRPFWGTQAAPIRLTTIASGAQGLARSALGLLRGRPSPRVRPETGYHSSNVHECLLELDAGLVLDGELFEPEADRRVRLTAGDRMRFVRA